MQRTGSCLVLAIAAIAALVSVGPSHAAFKGSNGLIVYYSEPTPGHHGQLFSVRPDGSDVQQLTHFTDSDAQHAAWSPGGAHLVFERDFENHAEIVIRRVDGGSLTLLTPHGLQGMPAYSPDGRTIVFDRTLPKEDALWVMRSNGTKLRQLTHNKPAGLGECRCESSPVFSPDGTRIAFVRHITATKTAAFVVNLNGTGLKQVTPWSFGVTDKIDWSPDGSKLLISSPSVEGSSLAANVFTVRPDGSKLTQITHESTPGIQDVAESYSPDGTKIIFAKTTPGGPYQLYVMNADGSGATPLTTGVDAHWANWGSHT